MVSTHLPTRVGTQDLLGIRPSAAPLDHALTLLLADETEAALRWSAAALERDPLDAMALVVTSRLLDQMGRTRAAIDGLRLSARRAIETGNLPLAVAAIDDLRVLGADVRDPLDKVASAFCRGSDRLEGAEAQPAPPAPPFGEFLEPLSPFLAGPPLASRVVQIVVAAKQAHDGAVGAEPPPVAPWPLFSALSRDALADLLAVFHVMTVPAGHRIIEEGQEGDGGFLVVEGEVEIARRAAPGDNKPRLALSSLGNGAFFGEMALLSRLPSTTSATAKRPTILLSAKRDSLAALAARRPEVAIQLAAHCRRVSLANLGWTSSVIALIPKDERAALIERLQMRVFERGEKLVREREDAKGLHLIVSGEVAIVGREWSERVLLATLGPGETVGEVELVLCRQSYADAIAARPTAALFLSREEYSAIVQDRPTVLHGLYATAVRRHAETRLALDMGSAVVADDWLLEEDTETRIVANEDAATSRVLPPAAVAKPQPTAKGPRVPRTLTPPPLPVPVIVDPVPVPAMPAASADTATPQPSATTTLPSMAPITASIRPSSTTKPPPRRSLLGPRNVATVGALVACGAAAMMVWVARDGDPRMRSSALGGAAASRPAAEAPTAASTSQAPAAAEAATLGTSWVPIASATPPPPAEPPPAPAPPAVAPVAAPAPARAVAARPRPVVHVEPAAPRPAPAARPAEATPAAAASAAPVAPAAPAAVAATPAPAPAAPVAAAPPAKVADEFGGRE